MEGRAAPSGRLRLIVAVIMALFLVTALSSATRRGVSRGFDETAHLSYVAELQSRGPVRLEQMRMLDPISFRFLDSPNYLNHAAPYYAALALVGPRIEGNPGALLWHRLINVLIGAAGLGLLLAASLALARNEEEALIAIVALGCIPTLGPLAGLVNNDNLGFLGGALTLFASQRFLDTRSSGALVLAGAGVALAGAAKLTALLLCGGYFVAFLLIASRAARLRPAQLAIAAGALLLASLAPLDLWWAYGSPAPNTAGQQALLADSARVAGWDRAPRLGPFGYTADFLGQLLASWRPHYEATTLVHAAMLLLPLATLLIAAAGVAVGVGALRSRAGPDAVAVIVLAGSVAILATVAVHLGFSYQRHLATGWRLDAYARYYLPLAAIIPWASWLALRRVSAPRGRRALAAFLLVAPILFGLLG